MFYLPSPVNTEVWENLGSLGVGFPGGSEGKESTWNAGDPGSIPAWEESLQKGMATHSSILAQWIPWTEDPGGLQSMESQRIRHDWSDLAYRVSKDNTDTQWSINQLPFNVLNSWGGLGSQTQKELSSGSSNIGKKRIPIANDNKANK